MRKLRGAWIWSVALALGGCSALSRPTEPLPTLTVPAPETSAAKALVIVLPGRGDRLRQLRDSNIATAIQRAMPHADVLLVELTLPYYLQGSALERLHDEVIAPARQRGYARLYLVGASLGGMGILLYEREHPDAVDGLILMAPYMGDGEVLREINTAGGLARWDPGPVPATLTGNVAPREQWRVVKSMLDRPARASAVWLICGRQDRFHGASQMIATALPDDRYLEQEGGHLWKVWVVGAEQAFRRIAAVP